MADTFSFVCVAETEATSGSGARNSDTSEINSVTAPEGFVINKDKIKEEWIIKRGSENYVSHREFKDYVEIIPGTGIELPRTFEAAVHARSERGPFGGGGKSEVRFSGDFVKIQ